MSKKIISLLLAVMLTVSMLTVAVVSVSAEEGAEATYVVAGTESVFGSNWQFDSALAPTNVMTEVDGVYTLTVSVAEAIENVQFKIGVDTGSAESKKGEGSIGKALDGSASTAPEAGNFSFNVEDACDVTITYNPATNKVSYSGEFVTEYVFGVDYMIAVGNGDGPWLNEVNWDPIDETNRMEAVSEGVYQIVFENCYAIDNAELKFAANGTSTNKWNMSWGSSTFGGFGVWTDADKYNAPDGNISFQIGEGDTDEKLYTVTATIDISAWDPATLTGAKYMINVEAQEEETTEVPEETTVAPEETTVAPAAAPLTVIATSNFFSKTEAQYNAETKKLLVSYYFECDKDLLNFQIGTKGDGETVLDGITYDPEVLKVSEDWSKAKTVPMTGVTGLQVNLKGIEGAIKINGSNTGLWKVDPQVPFVQIEFDVLDLTGKGPVTTTIGCEFESLKVAELNEDEEPVNEEYLVQNKIVNEANMANFNVKTKTTLPESTYVPAEPTDAPEETTVAPEETTVAPAANVITANSNLFPTNTYEAKVGETVSVEYSLKANVFATQWLLSYDPSVLQLVTTSGFMPQMTAGAAYNVSAETGIVEGSASDLGLYKVTADAPFVAAQFKKIAEGDTTVTLFVSVLKTAELNDDGTVNEDSEEYVVLNGQVNENQTSATDLKTVINTVEEPTTDAPATEPTTTAPAEVPTQPASGAGSSTSDTPTSPAGTADTPTNNNGNGAVQTGDASMAIIILSVLVAGTAVMFVLRKREMF